ncbi:MAG: hypothetical protein HKL99_14650 [Burkholderiales bacterium]|nr:hypothetical protein [Burkholderiales bacterium]
MFIRTARQTQGSTLLPGTDHNRMPRIVLMERELGKMIELQGQDCVKTAQNTPVLADRHVGAKNELQAMRVAQQPCLARIRPLHGQSGIVCRETTRVIHNLPLGIAQDKPLRGNLLHAIFRGVLKPTELRVDA